MMSDKIPKSCNCTIDCAKGKMDECEAPNGRHKFVGYSNGIFNVNNCNRNGIGNEMGIEGVF